VAGKGATKYIFVTGGVLSGLGKGITAASIGKILKARGVRVTIQKCDVYLNVDAGTLNPAQHGECFVTKDGAETDLDVGHYERFLDEEMTQLSSLMSGRVLQKVISDERAGVYDGEDVQIIPHLTAAIQEFIVEAGSGYEVHIVEIGGTVGDYESLSFIEAIRELGMKLGRQHCIYVHVVYMPFLGTSKEFKTKPAQNSVRELRALGITPDVLVVRSETPPHNGHLAEKLSTFTGVLPEAIAILPNAPSVYQVPLTLERTGIANFITKRLRLKTKRVRLQDWEKMVATAMNRKLPVVDVAVVAKYLDNEDTYMSVFESLRAAGWKHEVRVKIKWIDAEAMTNPRKLKELRKYDGILVPGGFGSRGLEGKIAAAGYAMEHKLPYLGLCLGLQMAVIAAARKRFGVAASTPELDAECEHPVVDLMEHQRKITDKGGTMRLGNYECAIKPKTLAAKLYGQKSVMERHRHRYEVNNSYREVLESAGLVFSGQSPDGRLVEMIELKGHPFFIATQAHPEFRSRPNRPHPLFDGFIAHLKRSRYNKH
jgi:CTP synthase